MIRLWRFSAKSTKCTPLSVSRRAVSYTHLSLRDCLVRRDVNGFSLLLEKLHTDETACIIRYLSGLGIREAASIIIPE